MTCSFRPILDRVLVKPDPEIKQIGSIIVPDIVKVDAEGYKTGELVVTTGTVLAVGPGRTVHKGERLKFEGRPAQRDYFRPMELKVGQRVQFQAVGDGRAGVELNIDGEDVLLMREDDIIGIFKEASAAGR